MSCGSIESFVASCEWPSICMDRVRYFEDFSFALLLKHYLL
jgi:hypothetical protein